MLEENARFFQNVTFFLQYEIFHRDVIHLYFCLFEGDTGCHDLRRTSSKCFASLRFLMSFMRGSRKFCQRGSNLVSFFLWWGVGGSKYHYKRVTIGPSAKRHLNGILLVCWWWPNIECWLTAVWFVRGSGPESLRNPIFLWFFRGGGSGPPVSPLDPHMSFM